MSISIPESMKSILLSVLLWAVPLLAMAAVESPTELPADENTESTGEEAQQQSRMDRYKAGIDSQVQRATLWTDSFFADPTYQAEEAYSQIRIRPELYYRKEQGAKGKIKVSARLNLPGLGQRVSLVAGVDEETGDFDTSVDDSADEGVIGLQFFMKESTRWNTSISAGVKFNEFAGFVGPRVRFTDVLGQKGSYRFTQTLRWQTNNAWQINTRLDLNRVISERFFFRQTFDGRWRGERAEEEGYRTKISSFLTQRLQTMAGLQYEFTTIFHTRPDTHVDKYVVAVRYRKRTKRDWLYYEIVPLIAFENEYDYKFNPGIRLRVELFFGGQAVDQFWRRESEDTDKFRW